jgi:hypothetical protein
VSCFGVRASIAVTVREGPRSGRRCHNRTVAMPNAKARARDEVKRCAEITYYVYGMLVTVL